jgi:2-polyprenyl-3-methyl-5-hydroxy-6-metoxy-1,4-benzoquinol methylase
MTDKNFIEIEGIKCFSRNHISEYADYPNGGIDFMQKGMEQSFWIRSRNRLFKKILYKYITKKKTLELLEIGCGTGEFLKNIAEDNMFSITGSEIYLKGLVYAKKNQPDINFIQYSILDDVIDAKFDVVIAFDVLEHLEDDDLAIKNINKLLNNCGLLILTVPQHKFLWSKLDLIVKHKRRYTKTELVSKLISRGLVIQYTTSFVFSLFPLLLCSRIFDKGNASEVMNEEMELRKRLIFNPAINWILDMIMRVDEFLILKGFSLPFGSTLVVVAKKD